MRALHALVRRTALAALGLVAAQAAWAQGYPDRPVRVIAGCAAGGGGQ
jgi:tripartite-type tricarboxylate transporter receptor subunit TctC